jgi:hypothetical protein
MSRQGERCFDRDLRLNHQHPIFCSTAVKKGERYVKEFIKEMWTQCGMRVVVLYGFKAGDGQVMSGG